MIGYETEARSRWGATDAYREHEKRTKNYTKEKWAEVNEGLLGIFAEFATLKNHKFSTNSPEVQTLVVKLQDFITGNYYTCTNEVLAGLGEMYACDERFKRNIDKYGEGTAEFVAEGIRIYVEKK